MDLKDFVKRGIDRVCFTALMCRVNAAVLARDLREFDKLVRFRKACGNVLQRS